MFTIGCYAFGLFLALTLSISFCTDTRLSPTQKFVLSLITSTMFATNFASLMDALKIFFKS